MASRDEILRELKLAPWRLRAGIPASAAAPDVATITVPPVRLVSVEDPAARRARIAALDWTTFDADVAACTACPLCRSRRRTVPGVGDRDADWLFVGEGPGAEEDARGEPFVGQAGKLLDAMLAALGMRRGDRVYIANVVKCRPPGNRNPEPDEIEACSPFLQAQIAAIGPTVIVALGKFAAQTLLQTETPISRLRGQFHSLGSVAVMPTFHPSYLLRNPAAKREVWEDMKMVMKKLTIDD